MSDVERLVDVLDRLVSERGASVIVIEHNLEVIARADWIVDLGPEGGSAGGRVLFSGTPADLVETAGASGNLVGVARSYTGDALREAVR
jgi:excinuclease UvrABC ATPase subunit